MLKKTLNRTNRIAFAKMLAIYLIIIIGTEAIFRKSLVDTFVWIAQNPFLFSMNLFTLLAISGVGLLVTKKIHWITYTVGTLAAVLSFVNIAKFSLRNVPLLYEDFFLVKEVWILLPQIVNAKMLIMVGVGVVFAVLLAFLTAKFFKSHPLKDHRVAALVLTFVSVGFLLIGQNINSADISIMKTGFIYSLSNNTRPQVMIEAEALEEATDIYTEYVNAYNERTTEKKLTEKPNIIVVQSEAFWDPTKLGVEYSQNPAVNFQSLRSESRYGELYVPVFGGGTSNTEFEILTGLTMKNYSSDWYMVYPNEIHSPTISLASILRHQGYKTVGIHPYMNWYYNRDEVYKHLGFDEFKTLEYMNDVEIVGEFASDHYTTNMIIDEIEKNEQPLFNFVVTMQNHGPYGNARFTPEELTVKVKDRLSDSATYFLNNYAQGVYLSDIELKRLVEYLKQSDEPTILLFYGDHLPMLGDDYQVYRESGYVGNESNEVLQADMRIMGVSYLLWSNFDQTSKELPAMNISNMTERLLRDAELEVPDYLKALAIASEKMPIFQRGVGYDAEGNEVTASDELYQNTQALNYMILEKLKNKSEIEPWVIADNAHYNEALKTIVMENATVEDETTTFTGKAFYEKMTVLINGEEVKFKWISDTSFSVHRALNEDDSVQCILKDTEGTEIARSKAFKIAD